METIVTIGGVEASDEPSKTDTREEGMMYEQLRDSCLFPACAAETFQQKNLSTGRTRAIRKFSTVQSELM